MLRWAGSPGCSSIRSRAAPASSSTTAAADRARPRARPPLDDRRPGRPVPEPARAAAAGDHPAAAGGRRSCAGARRRQGGVRLPVADVGEPLQRAGLARPVSADGGRSRRSTARCRLGSASPCGWCVSRTTRSRPCDPDLCAGRQPHRLCRRVPAPGHERGLAGRAERGAVAAGCATGADEPVPAQYRADGTSRPVRRIAAGRLELGVGLGPGPGQALRPLCCDAQSTRPRAQDRQRAAGDAQADAAATPPPAAPGSGRTRCHGSAGRRHAHS